MKKAEKEQVDAANKMLADTAMVEVPADPGGFAEVPEGSGWQTDADERDLNLVNFDTDGDTFTGRFLRFYAPGEHLILGNKYAMIGMVNEDGEECLLPGNQRLWDFLSDQTPDELARRTYRFTRKSKVPVSGGKEYVKFRVQYKD